MAIPTTPPSGFRDHLPDACERRWRLIQTIAKTYRSFGFQQVATSAVEELPVLLGKGGAENEKLIFKILKRGEKLEEAKASGELADMGLRFDLTLPLARYYSKYGSQLPHPFKAFHIGPVWRAERAQKGRYREFYQCDADIIGTDDVAAEIDVITAILAAFQAAGVQPDVLLNDRALLLKRLGEKGVPAEKIGAACVIIDKADKVPADKLKAELKELGVADPEALLDLAPVSDPRLSEIVASVNAACGRAAARLEPNLVRGFDYYTSTVFEFRLPGAAGSIGGGGRYDRLTEAFGGPKVPAVGGSIGFERLLLMLEEKEGAAAAPGPDCCVIVFKGMRDTAIALAAKLRDAGLSVDLYPAEARISKQFEYAQKKRARFAVIQGYDEKAAGTIKIKEMATKIETEETLESFLRRAKT